MVGPPPDTSSRGPDAPAPAPTPAPVRGGAGTADDRFAAKVVTGVEQFWRTEFPARFGRRWRDIQDFVAADPRDTADPPPCLRRSLDLTNQALYCSRLNTVVWDRTRLVPELRASYGDGAVVVALAHEIGHAVEDRLGIDEAAQISQPDVYPTILLEGMADCFAGVTLHAVAQGRVAGLSATPTAVDQALRGLLSFRDPVGMTGWNGAHGDAFDRASAFIRGYDSGAGQCAAMSVERTLFTERPYSSLAEASRGGNLPLRVLLERVKPDASDWFGRLAARGRQWPTLELLSGARCLATGAAGPGPSVFCPGSFTSSTSRELLSTVYGRYGDYASATVLASRYALAAMATLGRPVRGPGAGRMAVCLTGAYTGDLFDRGTGSGSGFELSPGDLDEAVDELLGEDLAARDAGGIPPSGDLGFDRLRQFRAGVLGGPTSCGI